MLQLASGVQVLAGLLLISGRYVPLALALLAPMVVNIFLFHVFLEPANIVLARHRGRRRDRPGVGLPRQVPPDAAGPLTHNCRLSNENAAPSEEGAAFSRAGPQ